MACPSEPVEKKRYVEKIKAIGGLDPYQIKREHLSSNPDDLPNITQPDIFTYLVLEKSKYTADAHSVLQELRKAKTTKQKHAALCEKVKGQLEEILALKNERDFLKERLNTLSAGSITDELRRHEDPQVAEGRRILTDLQEKISAYKLLGPCGLTVKEVNRSSMTVTFKPVWLSVRESFTLTLASDEGEGVKISSTNIPYFIDVHALAERKSKDLAELLDVISLKLVAYVQRKGEIEATLKNHSNVIVSSAVTEPVTSVDLVLKHIDAMTEIPKVLTVSITYNSIDDIQPDHIRFSAEDLSLPKDDEERLRVVLLSNPLSTAIVEVVDFMESSTVQVQPVHQESDDDLIDQEVAEDDEER